MELPAPIRQWTDGLPYQTDSIGMSGSQVLIYPEMVLKIQPANIEAEKERQMFKWLTGKLPIPRLLACEEKDGECYLLMSKLKGEMACAERYMLMPSLQSKLLADGLKRLWRVDPTGCPVDRRLHTQLAIAKRRIDEGKADVNAARINGFESPLAMFDWLTQHQPEEDLVVSHGDYCLPNIFLIDQELSGYIDIGQSGLADRWYDIALCYRSLIRNYDGTFGKSYPGLDETLLFRELGIEPEWDKIRFYLMLDDLF